MSSFVLAEDDRTCVSSLFKKLKDDEIITAEQFHEVCIMLAIMHIQQLYDLFHLN